jgi:hypothetical protein
MRPSLAQDTLGFVWSRRGIARPKQRRRTRWACGTSISAPAVLRTWRVTPRLAPARVGSDAISIAQLGADHRQVGVDASRTSNVVGDNRYTLTIYPLLAKG